VLREIIEGSSNQEIARHLMVTTSTVKSHINSIYRKLQTTSRVQTTVFSPSWLSGHSASAQSGL
jgi:two-component system, NarL family, nitrate/nitrite response regulator NarL